MTTSRALRCWSDAFDVKNVRLLCFANFAKPRVVIPIVNVRRNSCSLIDALVDARHCSNNCDCEAWHFDAFVGFTNISKAEDVAVSYVSS